jgi:hypothetical protein
MTAVRTVIAICLLAVMVFAGTAEEASAKRKKVATGASLESVSAEGIAGKISAKPDPCRARRIVQVYMVNSATPGTSGQVGTAVTSGDGTWSIREWAYPGQYYAIVSSKKTRHFVCLSATSNSVTWWTSGAPS